MMALGFPVVIAPEQVMVNIGLVVISIEVAQFVSVVILKVANIFECVVRLIVAVDFSWIVVSMGSVVVPMMIAEVLAMIVIMVPIKMLTMAVVVPLPRC